MSEVQELPASMPGVRDATTNMALFLHRLRSTGNISAAAAQALAGHATPARRYGKSECIVQEGQSGHVLSVLCEGLACSSRTLATGQQQNLAIFIPGDVLNPEQFLLARSSASVWAMTPVTVINIAHAGLSATIEQHPAVARALWRDMAAAMRVAQEWMVGMGRRSAYQRVAHFLCEVQTRFQAVGLATASECTFPLTQSELADTLGLSVVHINRVLQQLRRENLVQLSHAKLIVHDWPTLVRAGDFDPHYLDLHPAA